MLKFTNFFRLEQDHIYPITNIFKGLSSCRKLRRIGIITQKNTKTVNHAAFGKMLDKLCETLIFVYIKVGSRKEKMPLHKQKVKRKK